MASRRCACCNKAIDWVKERIWKNRDTPEDDYCSEECAELKRKTSTPLTPYRLRPMTKGRKLRIEAMRKIDPRLICNRCGCDDVNVLEINHKCLDGASERRRGTVGAVFFKAILSGKRSIDDLEITCKVCNIAHLVEMLGVEGGYRIRFSKKDYMTEVRIQAESGLSDQLILPKGI